MEALDVFDMLFSPRWITRWQQQQRPPAPPPPSGPGPRRRKKPPAPPKPRGFYERIFSLRVTLWYLIFQRLNFDGTLAAVIANL
ncbi:MAG: hypothetical protein H0W48_15240, partial [Methylibium sp.]|nr:hypothetical protein [Methylibium sp.]